MTQHLRKGGQSRQISARSSWPWGIFTQLQGLLLSWGEHLRATIEHFLTSLLARAFKAEISSKPRILQPFESTNKDCRKRQVQFPRQAARDQEYLRCVQTVVLRDERVVAMIIVPEGKDIDIAILLFQRKSWCQPLPATTASQDTIIRAAVAPRQGGHMALYRHPNAGHMRPSHSSPWPVNHSFAALGSARGPPYLHAVPFLPDIPLL